LLELTKVSAGQVLAQSAAILSQRLAGAAQPRHGARESLQKLADGLLFAIDIVPITLQLVMRVSVMCPADGFRRAGVVCHGQRSSGTLAAVMVMVFMVAMLVMATMFVMSAAIVMPTAAVSATPAPKSTPVATGSGRSRKGCNRTNEAGDIKAADHGCAPLKAVIQVDRGLLENPIICRVVAGRDVASGITSSLDGRRRGTIVTLAARVPTQLGLVSLVRMGVADANRPCLSRERAVAYRPILVCLHAADLLSFGMQSAVPRTNRRVAVYRLIAVALSIVIGLLLVEAAMRLAGYSPTYVNALGSFHEADEVTGHRGKRDFAARFKNPQFDVLVAHNSAGFRRQEYQNSPSSRNRMFAFGDSFTWGWGVDQGEVFTDQMSRQLPDWWIDNLGINDTGTVAQYELFAAECRHQLVAGDVVLLTFFENDFDDNVVGARHAELRNDEVVVVPANAKPMNGWKRRLQGSSYLLNYLAYQANRWQGERRRKRAHRQAVELAAAAEAEAREAARPRPPTESTASSSTASGPPPTGEPSDRAAAAQAVERAQLPGDAHAKIAITRHYLAKWKRDCDERHVRFLVAYIPCVTELDEGGNAAMARDERAYRQAFFSCAEAAGIETIDLLPGMWAAKHATGIEKVLIPGDGHWTAAGHRIVADIIASRLRGTSTARR
jgi:lysophospholipase L1-like esterase